MYTCKHSYTSFVLPNINYVTISKSTWYIWIAWKQIYNSEVCIEVKLKHETAYTDSRKKYDSGNR
jgi:hypothetical protein